MPDQGSNVVTVTIGTDGRDFASVASFEAALDDPDLFPKGSDVVAICHDGSIFEEAVVLDHRPYGLKSLKIISAGGKWDDQDWEASDGLQITKSIRFKN